MRIPRIDMLALGYRIFTFKNADIPKVAELFLKNGISARFHDSSVKISERKAKDVIKLLSGKYEYEISETLGALGVIFRLLKRRGALFSIVIFSLIFILSSFLVWDVRIEGVSPEIKAALENELNDAGLIEGRFWAAINKNEIENRVLQGSDKISWLNINRRGTVAYISAVERLDFDAPEKPKGYANIVAECDAIIEEIRVVRGYALVKAGDTVKKGEILISGAYPEEMGGGFCYAEGTVIGRYSGSCEVNVERNASVNLLKEKKRVSFSIKIFGISLKLYKNYRNSDSGCVIIEDEKVYSPLGGKELPIKSVSEILLIYEESRLERTDAEMISCAREQMSDLLVSELKDKTLLKLRTDAELFDNLYKMTSYYTCTSSLGRVLEFEAERK